MGQVTEFIAGTVERSENALLGVGEAPWNAGTFRRSKVERSGTISCNSLTGQDKGWNDVERNVERGTDLTSPPLVKQGGVGSEGGTERWNGGRDHECGSARQVGIGLVRGLSVVGCLPGEPWPTERGTVPASHPDGRHGEPRGRARDANVLAANQIGRLVRGVRGRAAVRGLIGIVSEYIYGAGRSVTLLARAGTEEWHGAFRAAIAFGLIGSKNDSI